MKITCSRARQLKITVFIYCLVRGSRPDYRAREDSWSRVRGLGSGHLVFRRVPPHYFGLAMFGNLEVFFVSLSLLSHCFVILIKY